MRFRTEDFDGLRSVSVWHVDRWVPLRQACDLTLTDPLTVLGAAPDDLVGILAGGEPVRERITALCGQVTSSEFPAGVIRLPFAPRSLRCFSGWQAHWEQAARVMARRYHPLKATAGRFISGYEALTHSTFPRLRPGKEFFEHPVYYTGNHMNIYVDQETVPWPGYCQDLDYELEIGAVLVHPLLDATEKEAEAAIGGFVVFNDLSSRQTQWHELTTGLFGPVVKTKTFANAMSAEVVSPDEVLANLDDLAGTVTVNGEVWSATSTSGMQYSIGEMAARASEGEQVHPGELIVTGTLPLGSGMELDRWLAADDLLTLDVERIGSVTSRIGHRQPMS
jgi:2-keto-4-pentenoate hydratase/2-oxohepta-3-ene-1,7-dioic acid hydratase in catechol pathway